MISLTVISLKDSHERRAFMQQQLDRLQIPFRFFDAVDGREMSSDALMKAAPSGGVEYSGLLTPGEIGCALSHLAVIRAIAEGEQTYAAVIEDDVAVSAEIRKILDEEFLRTLPRFDILQFEGERNSKRRLMLRVANLDGHELSALPKSSYSMCGLLYSRDAARAIVASIKDITAPIDNMIFYDGRVSLKIVEICPPVINHGIFASAINVRPRPRGIFSKADREVRRFRNWLRRWRSFLRAWGLSSALRLRGNRSPSVR